MTTIYIDSAFCCHPAQNADGTLTPVSTDFFDGKCAAFIEGYRFVPEGMTYVREDGEAFPGEMIAPHTDYPILAACQQQYEAMLAEAAAAYAEGVNEA